MVPDVVGQCWHCGASLTKADYSRENHCLSSGKATRCCQNCRLYQRGRPNDCLEPLAEPVADKVRANFCEHFDPTSCPSSGQSQGPAAAADDAQGLIQAAEALFK
jgi:hypothetical protein